MRSEKIKGASLVNTGDKPKIFGIAKNSTTKNPDGDRSFSRKPSCDCNTQCRCDDHCNCHDHCSCDSECNHCNCHDHCSCDIDCGCNGFSCSCEDYEYYCGSMG